MDSAKYLGQARQEPFLSWTRIRDSINFMLAISGIYALTDLYFNGQSIWKYIWPGLVAGVLNILVLMGDRKKRVKTTL